MQRQQTRAGTPGLGSPGLGNPGEDFDVTEFINSEKEEKHFLCTTVESIEGYQKIIRYDLGKLMTYSALATVFCRGTIFTMNNRTLLSMVLNTTIAFIACVVTTLFALDGGWDRLETLDVEPIKELASQINSLVPFVFGLYLTLSLKRWWDLRVKGLGSIFEQLTSVCMLLSVELNEARWKHVRITVAKFGLASMDLIVQAARHARHKPNLDRLVEQGLLEAYQKDALQSLDDVWERPMVCWAWILRICMSSLDYNRTPAPRTSEVMKRCLAAKDGMLYMNMHFDTPLPFGYVHLISLLVNVQNLVMALKSGIIFAQAFALTDYFAMAQSFVSLTVLVGLYQGILKLTCVLADPFGDEILNFPLTGYFNHMAVIVDAMFQSGKDCPVVAENGRLHHPKAEGLENNDNRGPTF